MRARVTIARDISSEVKMRHALTGRAWIVLAVLLAVSAPVRGVAMMSSADESTAVSSSVLECSTTASAQRAAPPAARRSVRGTTSDCASPAADGGAAG